MPMRTNQAQLEMLGINIPTPHPRHSRKITPKHIERIVSSIHAVGWRGAIIVDEENRIVAGVARWLGAKQLGMDTIPAIRERFLSEEQKLAFMLADDRLVELGEWDDVVLNDNLTHLFDSGANIEITGFSTADLDFGLVTKGGGDEEPVELPDETVGAITRIGDVWHIGPHRLICGDARDPAVWETLLGDARAVMIFADPPYNVKIGGFVSGLGKKTHREFVAGSGELSQPEFIAFLRAVFRNCARFSTNGSIHFQCMDFRHMREMLDASDGVYTEFKQLLVWNKGSGSMGTFYRSQHELIFAFKSGKGRHINNFGLGEKGRYRTNVLDYPGQSTFGKGRAQDLDDHPTVKPVALVADLILDCSNRGDLVVDPFSGSGTTLIAAHRANRVGAAIELDPIYCDTTLRRLAKASGLAVIHADGRSFEEVAAERQARGEA